MNGINSNYLRVLSPYQHEQIFVTLRQAPGLSVLFCPLQVGFLPEFLYIQPAVRKGAGVV